jgi:hypothetical protein
MMMKCDKSDTQVGQVSCESQVGQAGIVWQKIKYPVVRWLVNTWPIKAFVTRHSLLKLHSSDIRIHSTPAAVSRGLAGLCNETRSRCHLHNVAVKQPLQAASTAATPTGCDAIVFFPPLTHWQFIILCDDNRTQHNTDTFAQSQKLTTPRAASNDVAKLDVPRSTVNR